MGTIQVSGVRSTLTLPKIQVSRIRVDANQSPAKIQVSGVRVRTVSVATYSVEPYIVINLDPSYVQVAGPTMTLPSFVTPALVGGSSLTFTSASLGTVTYKVYPHTLFFTPGGVYKPLATAPPPAVSNLTLQTVVTLTAAGKVGVVGAAALNVSVSSVASASTMPVGNVTSGLQTWHQIFAEDFNTPVAIGGFTPAVSGASTGYLTTGAAATPYGAKMTVYPSGYNASSNGKSRPEKVLSVANSCLTYNFSIDATTGEAMAATVHYLIGSNTYSGSGAGYYINPTIGGRFAFRFKVVNAQALVGWGAVSQLIADNADWNAMHGELDINEGSLYGYAPLGMETNWHPYEAANESFQWGNQDWGNNVWHTSVVEWVPVGNAAEPGGRETVWIDGVKVGETVGDRVAQNNRAFFAFQTGVNSVPPVADGVTYPANGQIRGQLLVDWVVAYTP